MSNRWVASVIMLCPSQYRVAAAQTAAALSGNQADAQPLFFSRPVTFIDQSEPLYYLSHSRMREAVLVALPNLSIQFPGALYYITQHDDDADEQASQRLTTEQWLNSLGLKFLDDVDEVIYESEL